jgi:uncharacterized membrane protein HdeD (DUF308 family)
MKDESMKTNPAEEALKVPGAKPTLPISIGKKVSDRGARAESGVAVTIVIGAGMIFGGIARISAAFFADSFGSGALAFLWGLLVASSGFYMFTNPGVGLATLTLILSMLFFVSHREERGVPRQLIRGRTRTDRGTI